MSGWGTFEGETLEEVARLYRAEGYVVERARFDATHSRELANVDLVAQKDGETVFIEVRRASRYVHRQDDSQLPALAKAVGGIINSRLDVVTIPDPSDALPERDELLARASRASALIANDGDVHDQMAAFLLITSALEGALRVLAVRSEVHTDPDSTIGGLAASLWSIGLLTERQWQDLQALSETRDALAHGLRPERPLSPSDQVVAHELTQAAVAGAYLEAEDVVAWFHARYKDPADGVPYSSREGGYLYMNGGPYDAEEILSEEFVLAPPSVVAAALDELSAESSEWVGVDEY